MRAEAESQEVDKNTLSFLIEASEKIEKQKIIDDGNRYVFFATEERYEEFREKLKSV